MNTPNYINDGNLEIIYSNSFNIYDNKLSIKPLDDFEIIFIFADDVTIPTSRIHIEGDNTKKQVTISLTNFNSPLGVGTTKRIPILKTDDGKDILFSIHVTSLGSNSSMKQIVVTIYKNA